ncbi:MAG: flippase-like domain-containing protein [Actinomycetales bacterium]|nr:flippase-like domain-containing protein [Actinomycetales bacterium]
MADRVRRASDVYLTLAYVVLAALAITLGNLAVGTADALEQDLTIATGGLPRLLLQLFSWVAGVGVLILPIGVGVDLLLRSRGWQLIHALMAAGAAAGIAMLVKAAILDEQFTQVLAALTRPLRTGRTNPLDVLVVALVALIVVANISGRRWLASLAPVVIGSLVLTGFLAGANTALALLCSFLLGAIVGHTVRFAFGTTTTRAPGTAIARELVQAGAPLQTLTLVDEYNEGARLYHGLTPGGLIDVHVFDRDTFGLASGRRLLNRLRLRGATARAPSLSLRAGLEHRTLQTLALRWAGVWAPFLIAACEVDGASAVIATTRVEGVPLRVLGADLTDEQARAVVRMLVALQDHRIAFRGLTRDNVVILPDGAAGLTGVGDGDVGGDDISRRADAAQIMVMLALAIGVERAVDIAVEQAGQLRIARTLPLLQPLALGRDLRTALKARKGLLDELRERVVTLDGGHDQPATIELRRVTAKALLTFVGGAVAAYIVLPQLAQVDLGAVIATAQWGWALGGLAAAVLTFVGASLVLTGSVPTRLRFVRTFMTQLSVAFSGLVAPAAIGNIALNTRYLQRSGVPAGAAGASVGLAQVFQFSSYALLLAVAGVIAGTGPQSTFQPPAALVAAVPVVLLVLVALFAVPRVRRFFRERVIPQLRQVLPQVLAVFQRPRKLIELFGGALLLDVAFVAALYCATRAFGLQLPIAAVAVVYFAGAIIGSAVPTPGGLGGIEAALSYGIIALGVDSGTAVSAVLLYRIFTYWLPIPFGWVSLNYLTKIDAI